MIKFNVEVENRSNTAMDGMFLVLKEVVTYTGWNVGSIEKDDNTEEKEVDRLTREEAISPRSSDSWQGESCRNYVLAKINIILKRYFSKMGKKFSLEKIYSQEILRRYVNSGTV